MKNKLAGKLGLGFLGAAAAVAVPLATASCVDANTAAGGQTADQVSPEQATQSGTNQVQMSSAQTEARNKRHDKYDGYFTQIKNLQSGDTVGASTLLVRLFSGSNATDATTFAQSVAAGNVSALQGVADTSALQASTAYTDFIANPDGLTADTLPTLQKAFYQAYGDNGIEYLFVSQDEFAGNYLSRFKTYYASLSAQGDAFLGATGVNGVSLTKINPTTDIAYYATFLSATMNVIPFLGYQLDTAIISGKLSAWVASSLSGSASTVTQASTALVKAQMDYWFSSKFLGNLGDEIALYQDMYDYFVANVATVVAS